ncbi:uncharacterized protein ANIA_11528 [Aspergillus nidulans FGSC A4]|uniref:Uncharacterized protein n=1 Tax=Emericella nidulans (strain FGSC A4 / ATCC 38163 / CBS 112.46 / NRRL 194 / M139) TaxID=227321 RepID=C8V284_EMENI|nr:hypothetical protein [Aspergillus nidulans FGSC A4]CBF71472.1 TPA: hypothetical protein ANIA_11528 [Aspergillus nidulans FGSC A4]
MGRIYVQSRCQTGDLSDYHSSARCRMESLLTCSTREEYFHLIELLEAHETPKIAESDLEDSFLHADLVPVVKVQDLDHGEAVYDDSNF